MPQDDETVWSPMPAAISVDCIYATGSSGREVILISHPTTPFQIEISEGEIVGRTTLETAATAYLTSLIRVLREKRSSFENRFSEEYLQRLVQIVNEPALAWMRVWPALPGDEDDKSAVASRQLIRSVSGSEHRTFILVKSDAKNLDEALVDGPFSFNVDFGLRVVVHHINGENGGILSFGSMTAYPYAPGIVSSDDFNFRTSEPSLLTLGEDFSRIVLTNLGAIAQLTLPNSGMPAVEVELLKDSVVKFKSSGLDNLMPTRSLPLPYEYTVTLNLKGAEASPKLTSKRRLFAKAADVDIFEQDPSSWTKAAGAPRSIVERRPTRNEKTLQSFRVATQMLPLPPNNFALETGDFVVRLCHDQVREDGADSLEPLARSVGATPKRVDLRVDGDTVRSDNNTAIAAYHNVKQAFDLLRDFGINLNAYFSETEITPKKLHVFYRSGVSRGRNRDGRTINGEVWLRPTEPKKRIEMHLALGTLRHRTIREKDPSHPHHPNLTWGEYLGIANSERLVWHEFCHVLIAGSTGNLEFTFAHSAGDALAAIWADPHSALADPRVGTSPVFAPKGMRGYTFPWIFSTRRHDRCVLNGWSWGGAFQRPVTDSASSGQVIYKGYLSEQILSSTLFRLYLILGGDTLSVSSGGPDYKTRHVASRVTMYLIIRGIEALTAMHQTAEEFEVAMIDADVGLTMPLPVKLPSGPDSHDWVGGMTHKAIRWAFEAQGMHSTRPNEIVNAPGKPPLVDIYVPDLRPVTEETDAGIVAHARGGYVPVSLDWHPDSSQNSWMADPDRLLDLVAGNIPNRGDENPTDIKARWWSGLVFGEPTSPDWDRRYNIWWSMQGAGTSAELDKLDADIQTARDIHAGLSNNAALIIVLELSCPEDRANTDPDASLPCAVAAGKFPVSQLVLGNPFPRPPGAGFALAASRPRDLTDLVANDNNLGLYRLPL